MLYCFNRSSAVPIKTNSIKIAVAGKGYVGMSIAALLCRHLQVTAIDMIPKKVELIKISARGKQEITTVNQDILNDGDLKV